MTDYEVRITAPDAGCSEWIATCVDVNAGVELYMAAADEWNTAIVELVYVMAAELNARAPYLPDDYVDLVDRQAAHDAESGFEQSRRFAKSLLPGHYPIGVAAEPIEAGSFVQVSNDGAVTKMATSPPRMQGWEAPADAKCKVCGCTQDDCQRCIAKTGRPCTWTAENLCSACVEPHAFDPHPLNPMLCATCAAPGAQGDPVCQMTVLAAE